MTIFFSFTAAALGSPLFLVAGVAGFLGFFSTLAAAFLAFDGDDLEADDLDEPEGGTLEGAIVRFEAFEAFEIQILISRAAPKCIFDFLFPHFPDLSTVIANLQRLCAMFLIWDQITKPLCHCLNRYEAHFL